MDIFPVIGKWIPNQLCGLWLFLSFFFLWKSHVSDNRVGEKGNSHNINEKRLQAKGHGISWGIMVSDRNSLFGSKSLLARQLCVKEICASVSICDREINEISNLALVAKTQ